jgi:hypothetical protein
MPSFAGVLTHDDFDNLVAFLESRVTMPPAQTSSGAGVAAIAQAVGEGAPAVPKPWRIEYKDAFLFVVAVDIGRKDGAKLRPENVVIRYQPHLRYQSYQGRGDK